MKTIHLVVGPVGSGKSTFAKRIAAQHGAVRLTLDDWMAKLFGDDERPADRRARIAWYGERVERCLEVIREVTAQLLAAKVDVVLEIGLIRREEREAFYGWVDAHAFDLVIHVVDAPREERRARVLARNRDRGETFAMEVPPEFFELASDMWEPPDAGEFEGRAAVLVDTGTSPAASGVDPSKAATELGAMVAEILNYGTMLLVSDDEAAIEHAAKLRPWAQRYGALIRDTERRGAPITPPPNYDAIEDAVHDVLAPTANANTLRTRTRALLRAMGFDRARQKEMLTHARAAKKD